MPTQRNFGYVCMPYVTLAVSWVRKSIGQKVAIFRQKLQISSRGAIIGAQRSIFPKFLQNVFLKIFCFRFCILDEYFSSIRQFHDSPEFMAFPLATTPLVIAAYTYHPNKHFQVFKLFLADG